MVYPRAIDLSTDGTKIQFINLSSKVSRWNASGQREGALLYYRHASQSAFDSLYFITSQAACYLPK